jgi:outer membrane protein OmpA-like peptidoglycan-associated protein
MKSSFGFMFAAAVALAGVTGCATKNYVKTQTAPIVDHTNQLDDKTAANNRAIKDADERATAGINKVQSAADAAAQNAQNATAAAGTADTAANDAVHRADSLDSVVKGLDSYKSMADVTVTFGFDKAVLTKDDKDQLDSFAAQLGTAKSYILDLAAKYGVAAHRFYLIGIGKDKEVAPNTTADGRKQNRRVEVQLLSNMSNGQTTATSQPATPPTSN